MKYPRTYHLPYSPGATKDDKKLQDGWFSSYIGQEIVITAKLDGENIPIFPISKLCGSTDTICDGTVAGDNDLHPYLSFHGEIYQPITIGFNR